MRTDLYICKCYLLYTSYLLYSKRVRPTTFWICIICSWFAERSDVIDEGIDDFAAWMVISEVRVPTDDDRFRFDSIPHHFLVSEVRCTVMSQLVDRGFEFFSIIINHFLLCTRLVPKKKLETSHA